MTVLLWSKHVNFSFIIIIIIIIIIICCVDRLKYLLYLIRQRWCATLSQIPCGFWKSFCDVSGHLSCTILYIMAMLHFGISTLNCPFIQLDILWLLGSFISIRSYDIVTLYMLAFTMNCLYLCSCYCVYSLCLTSLESLLVIYTTTYLLLTRCVCVYCAVLRTNISYFRMHF